MIAGGGAATPGYGRAVAMLLAGGALAQVVPLLLGPWLARLFSAAQFGEYFVFAAVAANIGVVACARYEFALPIAAGEAEARALRALCLRILSWVALLSTLAALGWAWHTQQGWPLWLPLAVVLLAALSLATASATREQRFHRLAWARLVQHGGGAFLQGLLGLVQAGVHGLVVAPLLAAAAALAALGGWGPARADAQAVREAARKHRDFPLWNTPHAFLGQLQDTVTLALVAYSLGPAAAGAWGLAMRYLKAPATLVGGAVSQALYPQLAQLGRRRAGRALVVRTMGWLALVAAPLVALLWWKAADLFVFAFGAPWRPAGELAAALALYIGLHFVASPLGVVTMAWEAQPWALKLALVGQAAFVLAVAVGLRFGGLAGAGWAVSLLMAVYFAGYFFALARWPVQD